MGGVRPAKDGSHDARVDGEIYMKRKLIIDTDPGVDDAMALMLAIKSELFDLQAITTVCGNSTIEEVTRNARFVLERLERTDIPIYSGASRPLTRALQTSVVHGASGLGGIRPASVPSLTENAVEKILELVEANHEDITLVALGPLTNIAQAILESPQTMSSIKEIVMMGGAIKAPGNINRVAEFNFFVDPEAADIVFRFPVAKSIVPLDVCNKIRFSLADFAAVTKGRLRDILVKMAEPYIRSIAADEGIDAAPLYDPLTIFYLISPESCETVRCHIAIEREGLLTRGMSVADLRGKPECEANTTVVDSVDEKTFRSCFVETMSR
jgi:purine nucleosidase